MERIFQFFMMYITRKQKKQLIAFLIVGQNLILIKLMLL